MLDRMNRVFLQIRRITHIHSRGLKNPLRDECMALINSKISLGLKFPKININDFEDPLRGRGILLHYYHTLNDLESKNNSKNEILVRKMGVLCEMSNLMPSKEVEYFEIPKEVGRPYPVDFLRDLGDQYTLFFKIFLKQLMITFVSFDHDVIKFGNQFIKNILFYESLLEKLPSDLENLELERCLKVWNFPERSFVKYMIPLINPPVKVSEMRYIKYGDGTILIRVISATDKINTEKVILEFHGGGFIAMTSYSHEMYLRTWAIETQSTIVCVDYSLAPEHDVEYSQDECYYVYRELIAGRILDGPISRLLLAGDSAGGNLAFSVLNRVCNLNLI